LGGRRAADLLGQLANFSRLQPEPPNPWNIVLLIFTKMISAPGAKEAALHGSSSAVHRDALTEAL
jgi:hypothetical protein